MSELLPPRDPKMLLTEMSARIKIKDIKKIVELRDRVSVKWYESGLVAILFVSALSFLVIIIQLLPRSQTIVRNFVVGSSVALILIVTAILEFLLRKFHAMRQLYEVQSKLLEEHESELGKLRRAVEELGNPVQDARNDDPAQ